jgi:hypothetical protein
VIEQGCNRGAHQLAKLKGHNMSETQHQLLITLVHGTWPRGLFPKIVRFKQRLRKLIRRLDTPPFWFEEGSPFLARLSTELSDIPHKITPLLWSGANSIFVRDKTAQALAEHLSVEHAEHPEATQVVIAHSHGGNIALRALHHLHQRGASQECEADSATPLVVTLATPFIEVHQADFGRRPYLVRLAVVVAILMPLHVLTKAIFRAIFPDPLEYPLPHYMVTWIFFGFMWWYWLSHRATARRKDQVEALRDATRLGEIVSAQAQRLLIIRAIDDEASLSLARGTIANYVTTRAITYFWIALILSMVLATLFAYFLMFFSEQDWDRDPGYIEFAFVALVGTLLGDAGNIVFAALIFILLGWLMAWRSAHACELAVSPMELQINTQSAPDAKDLSRMVTLVRRTYVKSLRHGIYDHEDCAKTISDWVRSQLSPACGDRRGSQRHEKNSRVSDADHSPAV